MSLKKALLAVSPFVLMAQTSPDMPGDGQMSEVACRNITRICIDEYAERGYARGADCFMDLTGGGCPAPGVDGAHIDRVWAYWEGVIQMCGGGHC